MKIWRDKIEPPSTDYTWLRLNDNYEVTGTFKYKDSKWVLSKNTKTEDVDLSEVVGNAPAELDTLGEIASALGELTNTVGGISNTVSGLSTTVGGLSTTVEGLTNAKTTTLSASSTDAQYPSAKVVYDTIVDNEEVTAAALCDLDSRIIGLDNRVTALEQPSNILTITDHETIYSTTPKTKAQMAEFLNITESQLDDVFAFKYPILEQVNGNDSYYTYLDASSSVIGPTIKGIVWGNGVYSLRYEDGVGYFEEYIESME